MPPSLRFRRFEQADLSGVLELWDAAGWGSLDEATWNEWYEATPHGPAIVMVVEDEEGAIAGQFAMVPCEVVVSDARVRGLRSSAVLLREDVIFRRDVEGSHAGHPLLGLPAAAFELARGEGYGLVYTFPHAWALPILRGMDRFGVAPVQLATYPCVEIEATSSPPRRRGRLPTNLVGVVSSEHEELASRTPKALGAGCYVVRSLEWMRWRLGAKRLTEVRTRSGGLVALTAVDPQSGLVSDLHVVDAGYLEDALSAAAFTSPTGRVKLMVLPQFAPAVEELGCVEVDYEFLFACWTLDERQVPSEAIAPSSWLPMHAD